LLCSISDISFSLLVHFSLTHAFFSFL
jgi:COPII coat assembly protein SEC16